MCLIEWCSQRGIQTNVLQMSNEELDESLRRFYAKARTQTDQEYSRSSLLAFRNSIERHFIANNGRSLKLSGNPVFARSDKMLASKLKALRREGKENVQHKAVIESQDLIKLNNSPFMSPNTPAGLLRKVWFFCTLYWCRRGSEGQRLIRRDFELEKDADGINYVTMSHEELSKNHQGGFTDKSSDERQNACTAQVRTAMRFLVFASTSPSSTQGSSLSFKSPGKSSNSPLKCGSKIRHLESINFRQLWSRFPSGLACRRSTPTTVFEQRQSRCGLTLAFQPDMYTSWVFLAMPMSMA